jgi:ribosomal protein L11 methyltransferase
MHPLLTYELRVAIAGDTRQAAKTKERLIDWLLLNGVESFVEGELAVDINQNQDEPPRDYYTELGGDATPVSVYRYSRESLDDLQTKLEATFGAKVATELRTMQTETWMEGWKESFKPFATESFYVRPPWEAGPAGEQAKQLIDLVIEPGMAFGTGQHATTRLCLEQVGLDAKDHKGKLAGRRVLDVGTGTGILAIGAKKLGYGVCAGTDIEDDAILAAVENARMNQADVYLRKGSIPDEGGQYDLVLANILAVVLIRMMDELAAVTRPGGRLILSGLLVEEEDEVATRGEAAGLVRVRSGQLSGWSCLVLEKPAGRA